MSGLNVSPRERALNASFEACHRLARATAGNFYYSFLTLPRNEFRGMCALYAFLRITDDIGDQDAASAVKAGQLAEWEQRLLSAVECEGADASDVRGDLFTVPGGDERFQTIPAVAELVRRGDLPLAPLRDVVAGVRRDLEPVDIPDEQALSEYCYYVAGAVGLACIHLWGCRDEAARAPAVICGEAFQRTNILRDIREDAAAGRFYVPRETCRRYDCTRSDLAMGQGRERLADLLADQIRRAEACYGQAQELFDLLPARGRPILSAMIGIYRGLLDRIASEPLSVYQKRVSLPVWRKLLCVGKAIAWEQGRRACNGGYGN